MNIPIIIQARSTSKRLPGKINKEFCHGMTMIEFQARRLLNKFKTIIVATSNEKEDDNLANHLISKKITVYRGSLNNVMERLLLAAKTNKHGHEGFIRVGGDDPLVSIEGIETVMDQLRKNIESENNISMVYSSYNSGMPYGCACEGFNCKIFEQTYKFLVEINTMDKKTKIKYFEHTKPAFMNAAIKNKHGIDVQKALIPESYKNKLIKVSVDYPIDFIIASYTANCLTKQESIDFTIEELLGFAENNKEIFALNQKLHKDGFGEY